MASQDDIAQIQSCIQNKLDRKLIGNKKIAAVIGDSPSRYSKSPDLWNAAFRELRADTLYLPLDVDGSRLAELMAVFRTSKRVVGANVTLPHKIKIMDYLDDLDEKVRQTGAVNTIVRTHDGRLAGYNTDGDGFLESILRPEPGQSEPFLRSLAGASVLLIGAGGASRSLAFSMIERLQKGELVICNRTPEAAQSLAEDVRKLFPRVRAVSEDAIGHEARRVALIINGSTKGQGGVRKAGDGKLTILEPYSALAAASPAALPKSAYGTPEFYRDWLRGSLSDIEANNRKSWEIALSLPLNVAFYDLIYFPAETVFLRHGRLAGHRTLNGKGMIVAQAVEALFNRICREDLQNAGLYNAETYRRITEIMWAAW